MQFRFASLKALQVIARNVFVFGLRRATGEELCLIESVCVSVCVFFARKKKEKESERIIIEPGSIVWIIYFY